jgi:hypothetical protein
VLLRNCETRADVQLANTQGIVRRGGISQATGPHITTNSSRRFRTSPSRQTRLLVWHRRLEGLIRSDVRLRAAMRYDSGDCSSRNFWCNPSGSKPLGCLNEEDAFSNWNNHVVRRGVLGSLLARYPEINDGGLLEACRGDVICCRSYAATWRL